MPDGIRVLSAIAGLITVVGIFYWAMVVLMVPSAAMSPGVRLVFRSVRNVMRLLGSISRSEQPRRKLWALYVPVSLLGVIAVTLAVTVIGYTLIFYGISEDSLHVSYVNSVSSLSVLGFGGEPSTLWQTTLALIEAFTGPIMVALLIAYLATMNSSFNLRQHRLAQMDDALGGVDTGPSLLMQQAKTGRPDGMTAIWKSWAAEFSTLAANYDSVQAYLLLFAPSMHAHWVTDALIVLDAANFRNNVLDEPVDPDAANCLTQGTAAMTNAVKTFHHHVITLHRTDIAPDVTQDQFRQACTSLSEAGLTLKADLDAAWQRFSTERSVYAVSVKKLAQMMDAPIELW